MIRAPLISMQLGKWIIPNCLIFSFHMRSLEIAQMSLMFLGGRKIEEHLKSKKPHRELSSVICLLLLEVWNEIRTG